MSEQLLPVGSSDEPDLDQYLAAFITSLAQAGYAEKTQRDKARLIAPFLQWIAASQIRLHDVDDADTYINAFLACPGWRRYHHRCALQAFLAYLREVEVLPQPTSRHAQRRGHFQRRPARGCFCDRCVHPWSR